jgi:hypothetical protein
MNEMSRDVEAAVRAAARAATGYAGALDDVYKRARRRRRRRAAASFGAVAALLTTAGVGVALQRSPAPPPLLPQPAASVPVPEPAQRLLLTGAVGTYRSGGAPAVRLGAGQPVGELLPDGRIRGHEVAGADSWDRSVGLPDGRIVALGPLDTMPGVEREDGADVAGLKINLVVTGTSGAVEVQRDVRRKGEPVSLLTATGTTAYLWRPAGLVAHDLAAGTERVLVSRRALGVPGVLNGSIEAADLAGDRLVFSRASDPCAPSVLDVRSGAVVGNLRMSIVDCAGVSGLRLSPDGATVAVVYRTSDMDSAVRLALVRTTGAAVLSDSDVAGTEPAAVPKHNKQVMVDLAWRDDRTLRAVVVPVATDAQELKPFTLTTN